MMLQEGSGGVGEVKAVSGDGVVHYGCGVRFQYGRPAISGEWVRLPPRCQILRETVMDALAEFILLTVYCLVLSTILVLLSRPVRWAIRKIR